MKTLALLLASWCWSLPVVVLAAEPASAAGEPAAARQTDEQAASQRARDAVAPATADAQAQPSAGKHPTHEAADKGDAVGKDDVADQGDTARKDAAARKDDSSAPGGKVPSPADVAKSSAGKSTPQRFTPSEQVRPDFDVSFPIDI